MNRPTLAGIDLNLLVALDALLADGNVTEAGRRVGLSQPAMSHSLSKLRELLGDPLLVRKGQRYERTALAQRLAPEIRRVLSEIEASLLGHHAFVPATASRVFRIAMTDYASNALLPELAARLRKSAPGVTLEVHPFTGEPPIDRLARGELEFAIGVVLRGLDDLARERLFEDRLVSIVRHDHPILDGEITVERFAALEHLLISSPGYGPGVVDGALAKKGLSRHVAMRVPHFLAAPAIVAATDYVLTAPAGIFRGAPPSELRTFVPPLELPPVQLEMVWHEQAAQSAASRWLRAEVLATHSRRE